MAAMDEKVPGTNQQYPTPPSPGGFNPAILALMKTLFGNANPGVTGGGQDPSVQMPSRVVTGPPQVQGPPPSASGAPAAMPPTPQGAQPTQAVPSMSGPMEFSTGAGRSGAITSSAIGSVFGAIHEITQKKNQDEIQHAKFLYDMVTTAQNAGDQQTVNAVMGNDKLRKKIEKYLTGELPRVQPAPGQKAGGPQPKVNQPGGVALPQPSMESKNATMVQDMIAKRLAQNDPAVMESIIPGSSMTPDQFRQVTRSKYGLELSQAQVQAMSAEAGMAMEKYKADILRTMISKQADQEKAESIAKLQIAGRASDTEKEVAGRQNVAAMTNASRERIAKEHRALVEKLKTTPPDKMDQVIYKGQADLYRSQAKDYNDIAAKYEHDGHDDLAKELRAKGDAALKKGEELGQQYIWTKEAQKILGDIPAPSSSDDNE